MPVQPPPARPAANVHAPSMATAARSTRNASRASITSMGIAGGARQPPIQWVAAPPPAAPIVTQRQVNQWIPAPPPPAPTNAQRAAHRVALPSVQVHTGRHVPTHASHPVPRR